MSIEMLTNPQAIATDGDMKDKQLQVRVDAEIERKISELRVAEFQSGRSDKVPGKSEMVLLLIERAHDKLARANKKPSAK